MNALIALPLSVRLALVGLLGAMLGALVNWATYQLAWNKRKISPWGPLPKDAESRTALDRVPVLGWLRLRRESSLHGPGFWLRPMLIEIAMAVGLAALYWWEVDRQALVTSQLQNLLLFRGFPRVPLALPIVSDSLTHSFFLAHVLLIVLMAAASFIDIDEKLIPAEITVVGTVLGLVLMTLLPTALLPHVTEVPPVVGKTISLPPQIVGSAYAEPVTLVAPSPWPAKLDSWQALCLGMGCWWFWCFAEAPRIWRGKHGPWRALALIYRRVILELTRPPLGVFALAGTIIIPTVWWWGGGHWIGLLTSLVGMVVSGGLVWVVRLVGTAALRREAMGFGDVTLMMMVGTFVGWQAGVMIFFVAPFTAIVIGVLQLVLKHDDVIPYGPFLCLGTLTVIIWWPTFWSQPLQNIFGIGWLMPTVLLGSFVMLGVMLAIWQQIKMRLFGNRQ